MSRIGRVVVFFSTFDHTPLCPDPPRSDEHLRPRLVPRDPPGIPVVSLGGNTTRKFRPGFMGGPFGAKRGRHFLPRPTSVPWVRNHRLYRSGEFSPSFSRRVLELCLATSSAKMRWRLPPALISSAFPSTHQRAA